MSLNYESRSDAIVSNFLNSLAHIPSNLLQPWLTYIASPMYLNKIFILNTWFKSAFRHELTQCVKAFPTRIHSYMPEYNDLISQIGESDNKFDKESYIHSAMTLRKHSKKILYKILQECMNYQSHITRESSLASNGVFENEIKFCQKNYKFYKLCCLYIFPKNKEIWEKDLKNNKISKINKIINLYDEIYKYFHETYLSASNITIVAYNPGIELSKHDKEWKFEIYINGELKETINGVEFKIQFHRKESSLARLYLKYTAKKRKIVKKNKDKDKDKNENENDSKEQDGKVNETENKEKVVEDLININDLEKEKNNGQQDGSKNNNNNNNDT